MGRLKNIIEMCKDHHVSDIHFHVGEPPYIRARGDVTAVNGQSAVTNEEMQEFMREIELPQGKFDEMKRCGSCDFGVVLNEYQSLRLNFYYQRKALAVAIRCLNGKIPDFETLALPEQMKNVLLQKSGLVLVTGLTGNGKSTTIASLINMINTTSKRHIITIEDPIEYRYPHAESLVTQREIHTDCSSFYEGLRSALRQDPDIIVIGEMRDKETISVTMDAAESGHLVFSTLHTSSAMATVDRLVSYFSDEEQNAFRSKLASVLNAVFAQKLIPAEGGGMRAAVEIMFPNIPIRSLIREGKIYQITNYIKLNSTREMITMDDCLMDMVQKGIISYENAFINANDQDSFRAAYIAYQAGTKKQKRLK